MSINPIAVRKVDGKWRVFVENLSPHPDMQSTHPAEGYPKSSWQSAMDTANVLAALRRAFHAAHSAHK